MAVSKTTTVLREFEEKTVTLAELRGGFERRSIEKATERLSEQLCAAYVSQSPQMRIHMIMAFQHKPAMLRRMFAYAESSLEAAEKAYDKQDYRAAAQALQSAIVADALIDGRMDEDALGRLQDRLLAMANTLDYNVGTFAESLRIADDVQIRYAHAQHDRGHDGIAIETLGRLLQQNPKIEYDNDFAEAAIEVTQKTPQTAMLLLADPYLRQRFIKEQVATTTQNRETQEAPAIASTRETTETHALRHESFTRASICLTLGALLIAGELAALGRVFQSIEIDMSGIARALFEGAVIVAGVALIAAGLYALIRGIAPVRLALGRWEYRGSPARVMGLALIAGGLATIYGLGLHLRLNLAEIAGLSFADMIAIGLLQIVAAILLTGILFVVGFGYSVRARQ